MKSNDHPLPIAYKRWMYALTFIMLVGWLALASYLIRQSHPVPVPIYTDGRPIGQKIGPDTPVPGFKPTDYMSVTLDSTFPETQHRNDKKRSRFDVVANQVVRVMEIMLGGRKIPDRRRIIVSRRKKLGFFAKTDAVSNPIIIHIYLHLSAKMIAERQYAPFAFFLSHELGKVVMNARRDNGLMDSLATAVATETCSRLTDIYPTWNLPLEWQDYGANFKAYSNRLIDTNVIVYSRDVGPALRQGRWNEVTEYLSEHQYELRAPQSYRGWRLQEIAANVLRSQQVPWPELVNFASRIHSSSRHASGGREDLRIDLKGASPGLKAALGRMGYEARIGATMKVRSRLVQPSNVN